MRTLPIALLVALSLSGCIADDPEGTRTAADGVLDVYLFTYPGSLAAPGGRLGLLLEVTNPTEEEVLAHGCVAGSDSMDHGWAGPDIWMRGMSFTSDVIAGASCGDFLSMAPGASHAYLADLPVAEGTNLTFWFGPHMGPYDRVDVPFVAMPATQGVVPGMHVQTATVGVWTNGTSFYTNIAALNADPAFPAGYDRAEFGGDALPIYVYDVDRTEQPARSKDTCHFTTITGYNQLLKTQSEGSTGVSYLKPESAYTRPGNEEHFLFGDALVFLNTVTLVEGSTGPADAVPDPTGSCFAVENHAELPPTAA